MNIVDDLIVFEIDDWAVLEDKRTGKRYYEGHGGSDLLCSLLKLLEIKTVYFEEDVDYKEAEMTGNINSSILRWKMKNGY